MFQNLNKTDFPPTKKNVMIWDGDCSFCKYWTTRWKAITKDKVTFVPYQEAKDHFKDIDILHFKQASRFIELDGKIYSGPNSAYRSLSYNRKWAFLHRYYEKHSFFRKLSNGLYHFVARNRGFCFRITKLLFGANPEQVRPFWIVYLVIIMYFMYV